MNEFTAVEPAPRGGLKFKHLAVLVLLAFAGGGAATWWLANKYGYLNAAVETPAATADPMATPAAGVLAPTLPPADTVASIESRLSQINVDAAAASGNAARAEGLMIAFAARRAIDSGAPLGYLAEQLRVRFGGTQPQAVLTIVSAAQTPVTLEALQGELATLGPVLLSGNREGGTWSRMRQEVSELFVLRKDGAASPAPTRRLERAQALMESGNVAGAITEVSAMPGAVAAQGWLARARHYSQARQALDMLERGALATPVPAPVAPSIMQEPQNTATPR
jgi:hypothetical protein